MMEWSRLFSSVARRVVNLPRELVAIKIGPRGQKPDEILVSAPGSGASELPRPSFAVAIHGVLFSAMELVGQVHWHNSTLFYDIGDGLRMELVSGGPPFEGALPPSRVGMTGFAGFIVDCSIQGEPPLFRLYDYDADGRPTWIERLPKAGRVRLKSSLDTIGRNRAAIILTGAGKIEFSRLTLTPSAPIVSKADDNGDVNPLLDLVKDDYMAARKAGAEIPPPKLEQL